jgi:hypothetical protein
LPRLAIRKPLCSASRSPRRVQRPGSTVIFGQSLASRRFKRKSLLLHRARGASDGSGGYRGRTSRLGGVPDDEPRPLSREGADLGHPCEVAKFKRHPRGAKKPVPKRTQHVDSPHVSTAQLLSKFRESDLKGLPQNLKMTGPCLSRF